VNAGAFNAAKGSVILQSFQKIVTTRHKDLRLIIWSELKLIFSPIAVRLTRHFIGRGFFTKNAFAPTSIEFETSLWNSVPFPFMVLGSVTDEIILFYLIVAFVLYISLNP
jgi:hypothetical protein